MHLSFSTYLIILFSAFLLVHCAGTPEKDKGKVIAQVGSSKLYASDLKELATDSTWKEQYIQSWIKKQLIIAKAQKEIQIDEAELKRKLLDYKYDLLAYEFEKKFIQEKLDTSVTIDKIKDYYENNQGNFALKQNILKGYLVKIQKNKTEKAKIKNLLQTDKEEQFEQLKEYCIKFADSYHLNDSIWVDFDNLTKNTPFQQIVNKIIFLKSNHFSETADEDFVYYLKIKDYKISDQISPLTFVRNRIIEMIINQRKVQLKKKLEQEIYQKAKENNTFKIYKR